MPDPHQYTYFLSYKNRSSTNINNAAFYLAIPRPPTHQNASYFQIPLPMNSETGLSTTTQTNIESLLSHNQITVLESRRITRRMTQFVHRLMVYINVQGRTHVDLHVSFTDFNVQGYPTRDTANIITNLRRSVTVQTIDADTGNCPICLQSFLRSESINTIACNHKFHHSCIVNWVQINVSCPICRETNI